MKLFKVRINHKKAVITVVCLLCFRCKRLLITLLPSFGIFVYSDRTSSVMRWLFFDSDAGTFSNSVRKWFVSLMWDLIVSVKG